MNLFKTLKLRRSMLRHSNMAPDYELEFLNPDPDTDRSSDDDCASMVCEHDDFDEIYGTDYVDPVEDEIDVVDYNCPEHNVCALVEPHVSYDDLDLKLGGRWLLGADSDSESQDDRDDLSVDTFAQDLGNGLCPIIFSIRQLPVF